MLNISPAPSSSADDMPDDLKMAVYVSVSARYKKRNEEGFGTTGVTVAGSKINYADILPTEALMIFDSRKRDVWF